MIGYGPCRERIATALAAGEGPDIMMYNQNMPWFFGIEAVYPLNEFVLDPEIGIDPAQILPVRKGWNGGIACMKNIW